MAGLCCGLHVCVMCGGGPLVQSVTICGEDYGDSPRMARVARVHEWQGPHVVRVPAAINVTANVVCICARFFSNSIFPGMHACCQRQVVRTYIN